MVKKFLENVRKRDGSLVSFSEKRIEDAIFAAAKAVGGHDRKMAAQVTERVVHRLKMQFGTRPPTVEDIQDAVEKELIESGHAKTAKAYILYRQNRSNMRDSKAFLDKINKIIDDYVQITDWRVSENSNASYSLSGLQAHVSGAVIAEYALRNIYPAEIANAHREADFHIHDLGNGVFSGYCSGWSLRQLLEIGFGGVQGRISAKPAKHFNAALGQIVNFMGTLQNEWAGAQAFSSFDTYLAPLVRNDNLDYKRVKQCMQEFIFAINATSRWGNQVPFTNLTMDWVVPEDMSDVPVVLGGKEIENQLYSDFQKEMDLINKAFVEVMLEGDANNRVFTFPIPTYNITKNFDWNSENAQSLFEMTAKYGIPYFQNFMNSSLKPSDVRSMCCRLQLNLKELKQKTGGLFGSGEKTGSIGVVTINMPKMGYVSRDDSDMFERLDNLLYLAKESLEIKRKEVNRNINNGLLPWSKHYLGALDHHFSTIGLVGMNEFLENFMETSIATKAGKDFALKVLDFFRSRLTGFQDETGHIFNLEATPAEGTSYRLAKIDKKNYSDIKASGKEQPYYTNSTHLPVGHSDDIFEVLQHQDALQCKYTGGTVLHGFLGEALDSGEACGRLVKKIASSFKLPYYTITPTFSICPVHGYVKGKHFNCPTEVKGKEAEKNAEVQCTV